MIIGGPGAGKSWFSGRLVRLTGLPLLTVDDAVAAAEGTPDMAARIDRRVRAWSARPCWIIEGGNSRTYAARAARSDLVILMAPPLALRLVRVAARGAGPALLDWTRRYDGVFGPRDRAALDGVPVRRRRVLTSNADVGGFLRKIRARGAARKKPPRKRGG